FYTTVIPQPKAQANPAVALALGAEIGVGAYVGVALTVGGLAALFGYAEYSNEVNEHAKRVWTGTQEAIVSSVKKSWTTAVAAGDKVMTLAQDSYTYTMNTIKDSVVFATPKVIKMVDGFQDLIKVKDAYTQSTNVVPSTGNTFYFWNGDQISSANADASYRFWLSWGFSNNDQTLTITYNNTSSGTYPKTLATVTNPAITSKMSVAIQYKWLAAEVFPGLMTIVPTAEIPNMRTKSDKIIEDLVMNPKAKSLPAPLGSDIMARLRTDKTKTLTWNPADQVWINPTTGISVPLSDVVFDFPVPKVTTKDGVATVTVPIGGVQTDIKTGEAVGGGTIPGIENPPLDWGDTATNKLDFGPLKMTGDMLTQKFPFSIPWDIQRQLAIFDVSAQTPNIKIDKTMNVFGTQMKMKFDLDFAMFDTLAVIARWFLIIAFDLGVILSIRRFLPE
ncbi:hypothetical protein, partial [Paenibacillus gallinarum]